MICALRKQFRINLFDVAFQRMIKRTAFFFALCLTAGCAALWMPSRPRVTVAQLAVRQVTLSGMTLSVTLGVTNPNRIDMTLRHLSYRLYLAERLVAEGEISDPIVLPGRQTVYPFLPIRLSWKALQEGGISLFDEAGEVRYRLEGKLTLRVLDRDWEIPLHREGIMVK